MDKAQLGKEQLEQRLIEITQLIEDNMKTHNEMVTQRDEAINKGLARHNMLIGQRNEVQEWLAKMGDSES